MQMVPAMQSPCMMPSCWQDHAANKPSDSLLSALPDCPSMQMQALVEVSAERDQRQRELTANAGRSAALHQDISRLEQHLDACQRSVSICCMFVHHLHHVSTLARLLK
jgi:hypothetical protein